MIISQTPFRISFFGGGTDYPAWYRENGGAVLATTIDKYCYISCRYLPPFFEHRHRIVYSRIETVKDLSEIKHPSAREVLKFMGIEEGIEIHHDGDLPARSGVGSSSSFTVGLLNTLFALKGRVVSKKELARLAIHIEQDIIRETVGSQDQIAAAFGGLNVVSFSRDGDFSVRPVIMGKERKEDFESSLMLFFTGLSRIAETVARTKVENFHNKESELRIMHQLVSEAAGILEDPGAPLDDIGKMLDKTWKIKRELSDKVSTPLIDEIYDNAISAGALGGKLLGAGGGGFMLFYVRPEDQQRVRERLAGLIEVGFKFENKGSHIAHYDPNFGHKFSPIGLAGSKVERSLGNEIGR